MQALALKLYKRCRIRGAQHCKIDRVASEAMLQKLFCDRAITLDRRGCEPLLMLEMLPKSGGYTLRCGSLDMGRRTNTLSAQEAQQMVYLTPLQQSGLDANASV